jgi:RNA recognition motif. (a.k.a. RRM, RBD, or RNP domain)
MYRLLPWSTANEDLVKLIGAMGQVELAEILFGGTRSKGASVVQFAQVAEAETAVRTSLSKLSPSCESCLKRRGAIQPSSSNTCKEDRRYTLQ